MSKIPTPSLGTILVEEFMQPNNLDAVTLATAINLDPTTITKIINNQQSLTPDISIRLGRYFGVSDRYFINIQNDLEIRRFKEKHGSEYDDIEQIQMG